MHVQPSSEGFVKEAVMVSKTILIYNWLHHYCIIMCVCQNVIGVYLQNDVYSMTTAHKGKACIIAISEFQHGMQALAGYKIDARRLKDLWEQLGFNVTEPMSESDGTHNLTAGVRND